MFQHCSCRFHLLEGWVRGFSVHQESSIQSGRDPNTGAQVQWEVSSHKDVSPIICKMIVNDNSCEVGMLHFQADLSLTSHSRVLLIQIYI